MNLEYIDEFVTLAQTLNFQRAADQLFISQPVLSKHIKALEKELGFDLLVRKYHQLELTNEGKSFMAHAKVISDEYQKMMMDLPDQAGEEEQRELVVACSNGRKIQQLTTVAPRFHREFRDCALKIRQIETEDAEEQVKDDAVRIMLVTFYDCPINLENCQVEMLDECSRLVAFLPRYHRLSSLPCIQIEQLTKEHVISLPKAAFSTNVRDKILKERGLELNIVHYVRSRDVALNFVKNGLAVFLGLEDINDEKNLPEGVVSIPLDPDIKLRVQMIYREGNLTDEERWLINCLRSL